MRIPYVIDNDRHKLADVLNQVLETHRDLAMDVASAFFNVRGYGFLREKLKDLGSLRLLLGAEPRSGEDLGLKPRLAALQAALRGDLAAEPYRPETLALVEDLIRFLRQDHVRVRLFDHGFLHAKCYLFYGDPKGGPLFDRFRPVLGIVGSSNFTAARAATTRAGRDPTRRATARSRRSRSGAKAKSGRGIWDLADWFEGQWDQSRDFKQELIDLLDTSKFGSRNTRPTRCT